MEIGVASWSWWDVWDREAVESGEWSESWDEQGRRVIRVTWGKQVERGSCGVCGQQVCVCQVAGVGERQARQE